jgi:tetratricopeptide (TPR) repeat protein
MPKQKLGPTILKHCPLTKFFKFNLILLHLASQLLLPFTCLAKAPDPAADLTAKAKCCNKIMESEEAIALCNKAISVNPKYTPAYLERAIAYSSMGNTKQAFADLDIAKLDPVYQREAIKSKASIYVGLKKYDLAVRDLNVSLKSGGSVSALQLRAKAYEGLGKPQLAAQDITACLLQEPYKYELLEKRCALYLQSGQTKEALRDCNELIAQDKNVEDCLGNSNIFKIRAKILKSMGDKIGADRDLKKAAQIDKEALATAPFRSIRTRFENAKFKSK